MAESEPPPTVYANVFEATVGPYDLVITFGFKAPEAMKRQAPDYDSVARVAMSLGHAKAMLPILAKLIAGYEENIGTIPSPGFEDNAKG